MDDIKSTVDQQIQSEKVVIFSKTSCPYCIQVKNIFDSVGCKFTTYELDKMSDGKRIQDYLGNLTGARTVPRVFVKGRCHGGASDIKKLHSNGELLPLLKHQALYLDEFLSKYLKPILNELTWGSEWIGVISLK